MTRNARIETRPEGWVVHFDETVVTQLRVDHRFTLVVEDAMIAIGEAFVLHTRRLHVGAAG